VRMPIGRSLACLILALMLSAPAWAQDKAAVERGKSVVAEQKCTLCHSIGGKGNTKGPLDDVGAKLTADEIRQWLVSPKEMGEKTKATRKPPMKSFATLPKADLDALVAYLQTLKKA
jgi:mono/diheme cytochrome c family protein